MVDKRCNGALATIALFLIFFSGCSSTPATEDCSGDGHAACLTVEGELIDDDKSPQEGDAGATEPGDPEVSPQVSEQVPAGEAKTDGSQSKALCPTENMLKSVPSFPFVLALDLKKKGTSSEARLFSVHIPQLLEELLSMMGIKELEGLATGIWPNESGADGFIYLLFEKDFSVSKEQLLSIFPIGNFKGREDLIIDEVNQSEGQVRIFLDFKGTANDRVFGIDLKNRALYFSTPQAATILELVAKDTIPSSYEELGFIHQGSSCSTARGHLNSTLCQREKMELYASLCTYEEVLRSTTEAEGPYSVMGIEVNSGESDPELTTVLYNYDEIEGILHGKAVVSSTFVNGTSKTLVSAHTSLGPIPVIGD